VRLKNKPLVVVLSAAASRASRTSVNPITIKKNDLSLAVAVR
jgi:hypothetical protein